MARFSGPQQKGAMREQRQQARTEAEERQAAERARDATRKEETRAVTAEFEASPDGQAARDWAARLDAAAFVLRRRT